jgi:hypothetical protein
MESRMCPNHLSHQMKDDANTGEKVEEDDV